MDSNFLVFAIVVLPVMTVCAVILVQGVVRPMIDALIDAIRELSQVMNRVEPKDQTLLLEEVERLREEVRQLQEAQDFDRELLTPGRRDEG